MAAIIRVVSDKDWRTFIEVAGDGGGDPNPDPVKIGARPHQQKCASCHSVDGSKNTGPTWQGAWGKPVEFADGGSLDLTQPDAWENYAKESILYPAKHIHKGYPNQMVSYQGKITDDQLGAVIAYIKSLTPGAGGDVPAADAQPAAPAAPDAPKDNAPAPAAK
jgi:cytochrome c oxidase subunit 2